MVKRGRDSSTEREKATSKIIQALEKYPDVLGARELKAECKIGSNETFYKYLHWLESDKKITYREVNVGRGRPKKIYKLTQEGIAYLREFRVIEHFEKIRESCTKNELFELDNYAFSYLVYGIPSKLDEEAKNKVACILKKINSNLIELENLKNQIVNKEAYSYRKKVSDIKNKIKQDVNIINIEENFEFDSELENEFQSYIPPKIKEKMKLEHQENFAILATHGPSFIDEYSLRPENYLIELVKWVKTWDEEKVNFIIEQLAKNKYVDQEAIDRIKKWNVPKGIITNHWWQKIKEKLEIIPKIREEMSKEKDNLIQSGKYKKIVGIFKSNSVITKDMVGEEKLDEIRRELSELN